jgi:hypothetical protein
MLEALFVGFVQLCVAYQARIIQENDCLLDIALCNLVEIDRPGDGGSKHL